MRSLEQKGASFSFKPLSLSEAELAELVVNRINAAIPGAIDQVRMVSTGTEATMTAIRLGARCDRSRQDY